MKRLSVEADIGTIVQQGNAGLWLPLENVKSGQINLRCTWFTLTAKPEDLSPPDQAIIGEEMLATAALFVKLDSAKNLPQSNKCCLWHHKCILQTYCWKYYLPEQADSVLVKREDGFKLLCPRRLV
ncbi:uncharacterized protein [Pocillopora verrucosa]|uniref:uncharacterized protein isoform X2 n=1 Tax=Pocillopora verrucosa TaxID=203993 RepID=UPI0033408B6E